MNDKNQFMRAVSIISVIVLFLLVFSSIFDDSDRYSEVSYSAFLDNVSSDMVSSAELSSSENKLVWKDKSGNQFVTLLPLNSPDFVSGLHEKNIAINVASKDSNIFLTFLVSSASFLINIVFLLFILRLFMNYSGGSGGLMGIKGSAAKLFEKSESKITFKDVAGIDECLEEVQEIVDFLKDPEKFSKIGGKIPKGCILIGPPGTGKTLLSKAMAGEAGVPFFITSGSSFVEMFVGLGASRIRSLFEEAKKAAPCIIFIDEIDAIGKSRGGHGFGGGHDEREQTLNQLLVEMDGFSSDKGIIVVAATNRHEILDKALLRPGRFDRQIYVPIPDLNGRKAILKSHLKDIKYSSDVDIDRIARGTPGFTGADLANLINEAALLAAKNDQKLVTMEDFEKSKDKLFLGKERKSLAMTEEEKKTIAYHEGGHALVSLFVKGADPVHKVTIIPRGRALGLVLNLPKKDNVLMSVTQLKAKLAIAMGGRVAEELVFGIDNVTSGASSDIFSATNIARKMVTEWGMSKKIGEINYSDDDDSGFRIAPKPNDIANLIEEEVKNLIVWARDEAVKILTEHRDKLDLIANTLLELETITGENLNQILEDGKIKKKRKMKVVSKEVDALPIS